jgi:prolipoprotein diacylglyceryl transferase
VSGTLLAAIPSPTQAVWQLGPFPLRAYALAILTGIALAVWIGERRYRARGGPAGTVVDVATWAVPFGVVGARLYHVATSPQAYFGAGGDPWRVLAVWEGGLGIWGAVGLGAVGAWVACRRAGLRFAPVADALAPGLLVGQAVGRLGNWFNNELYGRASDLPWALEVYRWDSAAGAAVRGADGEPVVLGTFHPTFLYEALWMLAAAVVLVLLDRRLRMGHGRVFAAYVVLYTAGRLWIEALRVDPATLVLGLRINLWVGAVVLLLAAAYLVVSARRRPGRESEVRSRAARETVRDSGVG